MKKSINFSGLGGKHGRYARSVQGLVDAMRAVGLSNDEIRAALINLKSLLPTEPQVKPAGEMERT